MRRRLRRELTLQMMTELNLQAISIAVLLETAFCGTACAQGMFDPFAGIVDGVAKELAVDMAVNPFQAAPLNNGDIVIGSPVTNSPATPEKSLSLMPEQPKENFIYDLVIPDLCISVPALADCRNFRPMIRRPVPDAERQTVQGVNLVSSMNDD